MVTEYCSRPSFVDDSYAQNVEKRYVSFAADRRELDSIPEYPKEPYSVNSFDVTSLDEAANFLYLINPCSFGSKESFLDALRKTDYDVIIIDLFYDGTALGSSHVTSLRNKANGSLSADNVLYECW